MSGVAVDTRCEGRRRGSRVRRGGRRHNQFADGDSVVGAVAPSRPPPTTRQGPGRVPRPALGGRAGAGGPIIMPYSAYSVDDYRRGRTPRWDSQTASPLAIAPCGSLVKALVTPKTLAAQNAWARARATPNRDELNNLVPVPSHASLDPNARSIEMIRSHAEKQVVDVVCMAGGLAADPSSMDVCDDGASEDEAELMASEKAEVFMKLNEQRKAAIDMWLQQTDEACEAAIKTANFIDEPYPQAAYNAAYINAHVKMEQLYAAIQRARDDVPLEAIDERSAVHGAKRHSST